jgi:hypothetical protein
MPGSRQFGHGLLGRQLAHPLEIEPVVADPAASASSVFCFGRDSPASVRRSAPCASTRLRRQRVDERHRRAWIASALARETCWETMIEHRLAKPASRLRSGTSPARLDHLAQPPVRREAPPARAACRQGLDAVHLRPCLALRRLRA